MKRIIVSLLFLVASVAYAADEFSRPENSVPTPVEKNEMCENSPVLDSKDNEDWEKMREERREARQRILQELRKNSSEEKKAVRGDASSRNKELKNFHDGRRNRERANSKGNHKH